MIAQLLVNSFIAAAVYTLVGLGFAMVYWVARFFNFAHATVYATAAYVAYLFAVRLHVPLLIAAALSIGASGLSGGLLELCAYRPLRRRQVSSLGLLLASFGLMVASQNLLSLIFGNDTKSLTPSRVIEIGYGILGARITFLQTGMVLSAILLSTLLWIILHRSKVGRMLRAVANDPELATVYGIDANRVILWAIVAGSSLGGFAGILVALDTDVNPEMGMRVLLFAVVAVVIGGQGRIAGVALGGLLVGLAQNLGVLFLSTAWQDGIIFVLLILFLLARPGGFLGGPQKRTAV